MPPSGPEACTGVDVDVVGWHVADKAPDVIGVHPDAVTCCGSRVTCGHPGVLFTGTMCAGAGGGGGRWGSRSLESGWTAVESC